MNRRLIYIAIALSISLFSLPVAVYGNNSVTQNASTKNLTAISVRDQYYDQEISTITFPSSAPGSTVSNPYNNVNGINNPQSFGSSPGSFLPVFTLVNPDPNYEFLIYYQISSWTNDVVSSEYILIKDKGTACANADEINVPVTFNTPTNSYKVISPSGNPEGARKDVYLKVVLSNTGGLTGSSTITILSEIP